MQPHKTYELIERTSRGGGGCERKRKRKKDRELWLSFVGVGKGGDERQQRKQNDPRKPFILTKTRKRRGIHLYAVVEVGREGKK